MELSRAAVLRLLDAKCKKDSFLIQKKMYYIAVIQKSIFHMTLMFKTYKIVISRRDVLATCYNFQIIFTDKK